MLQLNEVEHVKVPPKMLQCLLSLHIWLYFDIQGLLSWNQDWLMMPAICLATHLQRTFLILYTILKCLLWYLRKNKQECGYLPLTYAVSWPRR